MPRFAGDEPAAEVAAALAPYAWRDHTDLMLARRVVGAVDRCTVVRFLASTAGADLGELPPLDPADTGDERVQFLTTVLGGQQWRGWSLGRLSASLVASLESWQSGRESLESDLRRLLEGR